MESDSTSEYEVGSGNVFADIGRKDAGELLEKTELVRRIGLAITEQGMTRTQAEILGITQPTRSDLMRGCRSNSRWSG